MYIFLHNGIVHQVLETLGILIQLEKDAKKTKTFFQVSQRTHEWIPTKYGTDWIWVLWEGLLLWSPTNNKLKENIKALFFLFCHNYTPPKKSSKLCLLINAFLLISQPLDTTKQILDKGFVPIVSKACQNIHALYKEIEDIHLQNQYKLTPSQPSFNQHRSYADEQLENEFALVNYSQPIQMQPILSQTEYLSSNNAPQVKQPDKKGKKNKQNNNEHLGDSFKKMDFIDSVLLGKS